MSNAECEKVVYHLQQFNPVAVALDFLGGVASVENRIAVVNDPLIVVLRMVGQDHGQM